MVAVAQLVEHRIVIPVVAGSIPVSHPIFQKAVHSGRLFHWFCSVLNRLSSHTSTDACTESKGVLESQLSEVSQKARSFQPVIDVCSKTMG